MIRASAEPPPGVDQAAAYPAGYREARQTCRPSLACVVCGVRDARVLSTTPLANGERAVVCGSHELSHRRAAVKAENVSQLRTAFRDRRVMGARRETRGDELGVELSVAFGGEKRVARDRRRA